MRVKETEIDRQTDRHTDIQIMRETDIKDTEQQTHSAIQLFCD